jgi:hypothetical protein
MSILQLNREREKNILIRNKENENFLNINLSSSQNERKKISSGRKDLTKYSTKTIQNYLNSVALQLNTMGSKIHPINLQSFKKEFNQKDSSEVRRNHLRNPNKSHSDKFLPNMLKRKDFKDYLKFSPSHSQSNISSKFVEEINLGEYEKITIQNIFKFREKAAIIIQNFFRKTYAQKKIKVVYLLEKILKVRRESTLKIQSNLKGYFCRKNVIQILMMKEENFPFFYYKKNIDSISKFDIKDIFMIVKQEKYNQVLNFKFNRFLNCFILFIRKNDSYKSRYKIIFVINGKKIVDTAFEIFYEEDGSCYNILDFEVLKKKGFLSNIEECYKLSTPMQPKLKRPMTLDILPSVYEALRTKHFRILKPCIKKSSENIYHPIISKKKVSFNLRMNNFFY